MNQPKPKESPERPPTQPAEAGRPDRPHRKWPVPLRMLFIVAASIALWSVIVLFVLLIAG